MRSLLAACVVLGVRAYDQRHLAGSGSRPRPRPTPRPTPRPVPSPTPRPTYAATPVPSALPSPGPTTETAGPTPTPAPAPVSACDVVANANAEDLYKDTYTSMEDAYDSDTYGHATYACAEHLVEDLAPARQGRALPLRSSATSAPA
ncbi:hypothetical protein SO694_0014009 [Aureococcus anophagefferens]|uniref:Uncharacterized protein n=1 Tax=Aureococcus anophagefferens TaxID=44056 RepID=A0ABR1FPF6_AURAN